MHTPGDAPPLLKRCSMSRTPQTQKQVTTALHTRSVANSEAQMMGSLGVQQAGLS
jgi:hypothetical protein